MDSRKTGWESSRERGGMWFWESVDVVKKGRPEIGGVITRRGIHFARYFCTSQNLLSITYPLVRHFSLIQHPSQI